MMIGERDMDRDVYNEYFVYRDVLVDPFHLILVV
jgi:hypothetical protein